MVSLIVPAWNEERLIGGTLAALHAAARAAGEPYEIIVVDDGSTDATAGVARRGGARVVRVEYRQIAAARNAGAAQATGELLVFVDADTIVPGAVLSAAVRAMRDGAAGGGARARFNRPVSPYGRLLEWTWRCIQRIGQLAAGSFIFCTRAAFQAAGGFDATLYAAEDVVLSRRLRRIGRFVIVPGAVATSARAVRGYSGIEALRLLAGFLVRGPSYFRTRRGPWYNRRDEETDPTVRSRP